MPKIEQIRIRTEPIMILRIGSIFSESVKPIRFKIKTGMNVAINTSTRNLVIIQTSASIVPRVIQYIELQIESAIYYRGT
jgi:hypothetical protein